MNHDTTRKNELILSARKKELKSSSDSHLLMMLLKGIVETYSDFALEKAKEFGISPKGTIDPSTFNSIVEMSAHQCEVVLSQKTKSRRLSDDSDSALLIEFCALMFVSDELVEKRPSYANDVFKLVLNNLSNGEKKLLANRMAWIIDDIVCDSYEALLFMKDSFFKIFFGIEEDDDEDDEEDCSEDNSQEGAES